MKKMQQLLAATVLQAQSPWADEEPGHTSDIAHPR
jgi:hypothetical protein